MPLKNPGNHPTDISLLLTELSKAGIQFILVGGIAAIAQGAPLTTFDLDIVHQRTPENISKIKDFLSSVEAIYRRPDSKIIKPDPSILKEKGHILLMTCHGPLDLLAYIENGLEYDDLIHESIEIEFQGFPIRVLSLKAIVALKKDSKRPEDRYRLQILEETLKQISHNT